MRCLKNFRRMSISSSVSFFSSNRRIKAFTCSFVRGSIFEIVSAGIVSSFMDITPTNFAVAFRYEFFIVSLMVETPVFRRENLQIFVYDVLNDALYPRITYGLPPSLPHCMDNEISLPSFARRSEIASEKDYS